MAVAVVCIDIYNKSTKKRSPSYFYSFLFWCNNMNMNNNSDCRQTFATISREKHIVYTTYADCSSEWNPFKNIKKRLFQSFVELWKMIKRIRMHACIHAYIVYCTHTVFVIALNVTFFRKNVWYFVCIGATAAQCTIHNVFLCSECRVHTVDTEAYISCFFANASQLLNALS